MKNLFTLNYIGQALLAMLLIQQVDAQVTQSTSVRSLILLFPKAFLCMDLLCCTSGITNISPVPIQGLQHWELTMSCQAIIDTADTSSVQA